MNCERGGGGGYRGGGWSNWTIVLLWQNKKIHFPRTPFLFQSILQLSSADALISFNPPAILATNCFLFLSLSLPHPLSLPLSTTLLFWLSLHPSSVASPSSPSIRTAHLHLRHVPTKGYMVHFLISSRHSGISGCSGALELSVPPFPPLYLHSLDCWKNDLCWPCSLFIAPTNTHAPPLSTSEASKWSLTAWKREKQEVKLHESQRR